MTPQTRKAVPARSDAGRRIDLDAARLARAEERGDPPVVVVGGVEYPLPAEMPADVVTAFGMVARGDVASFESALVAIFGAENLAAIKATGLSWDDEKYLFEAVVEEYGFDLPGSSASGAS